jgi:hypothetical protein
VSRTTRQRECIRCGDLYSELYPWPYDWPKAYCSKVCSRKILSAGSSTPRKPVSVASPEQRAKRIAGASIVSGETRGLDAAHLCSRGLGGCDDADCTVPLTHAEHVAFDDGKLDLLPYLVAHQCLAEMAHALEHYRGDLPALLERLTGTTWAPADAPESATVC